MINSSEDKKKLDVLRKFLYAYQKGNSNYMLYQNLYNFSANYDNLQNLLNLLLLGNYNSSNIQGIEHYGIEEHVGYFMVFVDYNNLYNNAHIKLYAKRLIALLDKQGSEFYFLTCQLKPDNINNGSIDYQYQQNFDFYTQQISGADYYNQHSVTIDNSSNCFLSLNEFEQRVYQLKRESQLTE